MKEHTDPHSRRPLAFFNLSAQDLADENIDATADWVAKVIRERSSRSTSPDADDLDQLRRSVALKISSLCHVSVPRSHRQNWAC